MAKQSHEEMLSNVIQMAKAVGITLTYTKPPLSHDPFNGYEERELRSVCGSNTITEIKTLYQKGLIAKWNEIKDTKDHDLIVSTGIALESTRGKNKGKRGIVIRHMPSKFKEGEVCYILYNPMTHSEVFANAKSTKVVALDKGVFDLYKSQVAVAEEHKFERGQNVYNHDGTKQGIVVAPSKKRNGSTMYTVGVQYNGDVIEAWELPHRLKTVL